MLIAKSKSEDDLNVNRRSNSGSWKGRFPQNNDRLLKKMVPPIKPWLTWSQTARDLHLLMPGNLLTLPETQACHPFDQGWRL